MQSCAERTHVPFTHVPLDNVLHLLLFSCSAVSDPWIVACQAPLSMEFPRQEYWSGLPLPSPGRKSHSLLPDLSLNLHLMHCRQIFFLPLSHPGKPNILHNCIQLQTKNLSINLILFIKINKLYSDVISFHMHSCVCV